MVVPNFPYLSSMTISKVTNSEEHHTKMGESQHTLENFVCDKKLAFLY